MKLRLLYIVITFDILEMQEWSAEYILPTSCLSSDISTSPGWVDRVSWKHSLSVG